MNEGGKGRPIANSEPLVYHVKMDLHRSLGQVELASYLLIRQSLRGEHDNLALPWSESAKLFDHNPSPERRAAAAPLRQTRA